MRRHATILVVAALAAPLLLLTPSPAAAQLSIEGFQYLWVEGTRAGPAGYLGTPAGPVPVGNPPQVSELSTIVNRDVVRHTFTACVAGCATANPVYNTAIFNIVLNPQQAANISGLFEGFSYFGCTFHPWMRGAIIVGG